MAKRVGLGQNRKLASINFKINLPIPFSVSSDNKDDKMEKMIIEFSRYCGNDDETISQSLRGIIFDELKAKDKREFEKIMVEEIAYVRDKIKERIKKLNKFQGNIWFSKMMRDAIENKLKEEQNEK